MAAQTSLRADVGTADRPGVAREQADHYAILLARAFEASDRVKLNRYASEYPGTEHPLAVRRLAATVRLAAQRLLDLLDGTLEVPPDHVVVVAPGTDGPLVEARRLAPAVLLRPGRPRFPQHAPARPS